MSFLSPLLGLRRKCKPTYNMCVYFHVPFYGKLDGIFHWGFSYELLTIWAEWGRLLLKEFARAEGASVTFGSYGEEAGLPAGGGWEVFHNETSRWVAEPFIKWHPQQPAPVVSTVGLLCHTSSCGMLCLILCGLPASAVHRKLRIPNTQSKAQKGSLTRRGAELPQGPLQDWRGYMLSSWSYPGHVQAVVKQNLFLGSYWKSNFKSVWVTWGLSMVCVSVCFL